MERSLGTNGARRGGESWTGRSIGVAWGWRICAWSVRVLGRWPAYALITPIVGYYFLRDGRGRRASRDYWRRVAPGRGWLARGWASLRQYHAFAVSLVDRYLLLVEGPDAFTFEETGREAVERAARRGAGLVLVTSHLGAADMAAGVLAGGGLPLVAVRIQAERPEIRALHDASTRASRPRTIALGGPGSAMLSILGELRRGSIVGMMGDRVVDESWIEVPFLGSPAPFPAGPFLVAALAGVPLAASFCVKVAPDRYCVETLPPRTLDLAEGRPAQEQVRAWVARYARELEERVRRHPHQWYNFFDVWGPEGLPPRRSFRGLRGPGPRRAPRTPGDRPRSRRA